MVINAIAIRKQIPKIKRRYLRKYKTRIKTGNVKQRGYPMAIRMLGITNDMI